MRQAGRVRQHMYVCVLKCDKKASFSGPQRNPAVEPPPAPPAPPPHLRFHLLTASIWWANICLSIFVFVALSLVSGLFRFPKGEYSKPPKKCIFLYHQADRRARPLWSRGTHFSWVLLAQMVLKSRLAPSPSPVPNLVASFSTNRFFIARI